MFKHAETAKGLPLLLAKAKSLLLAEHIYLLLGLVATLAALHLSLVASNPVERENLVYYVFCWSAIVFLLWKNRKLHAPVQKPFSSFSNFLGLTLLLVVILRPINLWAIDIVLFRLGPIVAGVGVGLLAFGFRRLRQKWREFLVLCLMVFPYGGLDVLLYTKLRFSQITTAVSAFLLHYIGVKTTYQDAFLSVPTGIVEVKYTCTGGPLIIWLIKVSLVMMVIFPLKWSQKLALIAFSIGAGFIIGCIRVGVLVSIVHNHSLFKYWHGDEGTQIFLMATIFIFVGYSTWLLPVEDYVTTDSLESGEVSNNPAIPTDTTKNHTPAMLVITWVGVILSTLYLLAIPTVGRRPLKAYVFSDTLVDPGWQLQSAKTTVLNTKPDSLLIPQPDQVVTGKQYKIVKDNQAVEISLWYILNTKGDAFELLNKLTKVEFKTPQKQISKLEGVGYYAIATETEKAYLTTCINPRGETTVTWDQFNHNRNQYDYTWSRILPWLLGKEILKDNRCIMVQLSTPLGKNSDKAYGTLKSVFAANVTNWRSQFPPTFD